MDEIFFVDLPDREIRCDILRIHLNKRKLSPLNFSIEKIADACEGFSGAEIEQAIVAAIYVALSEHITVNTEHIINEMHLTKPLSILMSEKITKLRQWALGRTVSASGEKVIA
jgi:SpoVK/Ycf46/Vps4 family AAA+-type ATPase